MIRIHKKIKIEVLLGLALALHLGPVTMAMPTGGVVVGGSGSISTSGNTMNVAQQTKNMFINWDAFSVGNGEKVQFTGPQDFAVLNRVVGHDESKIYGEISAASHGNVYLINPNGILIGDGAAINTGSFIASTKDVIDVPSFIASGKVNFTGDARGNIINLGAVKADHIEMHGDTISLKAANVNQNFDAPQVLIDANSIHAGVRVGETTADVDKKLGVKSEVFQLKNTMQDIRKAVKEDKDGKYMLDQNDGSEETWNDGDKPVLGSGAIDGLGYTVAHKTITAGGDGTGMFGSVTGNARVDNFTFDHMEVNGGKKDNGTGILAGCLNGSDLRIANVTISNGRVNGYNHVGGLIGSAFSTDTVTLLNVHNVNTSVTGNVEKDGQGNYTGVGIGGIIGYHNGEKNTEKKNVFYNVSNSGQITGRIYVGGLAGQLLSADMDQVLNTGRIEHQPSKEIGYANSWFIGGIAGAIGPRKEAANGVHISNAYNGGTIVDTNLSESYLGGNYIGGIVGMISGYDDENKNIYGAKNTVIEYAHNTGNITKGSTYIGGIVGFTTVAKNGTVDDVSIRHSWNDGKISCFYEAVGGLVGEFGGHLFESYNNASITGMVDRITGVVNGEAVGGLIGRKDMVLNSDLYVVDSYNSAKGTIKGSYSVGGILGSNNSAGKLTVKRVYNKGLSCEGYQNVGGIIGRIDNESSSTELDQIINFGNIGDSHMEGYECGGLIGEADIYINTSLSLTNSTNYGSIKGEYSLGGLIGELYNEQNSNVCLSNNKNFGSIDVKNDRSDNLQVGGLIGEYDSNDGSVEIIENANYGDINVESSSNGSVGGLVGLQWDGKLIINDTHNYGTITGANAHDFGGIIGRMYSSNASTYEPDVETMRNMLELHNVTTVGSAFDKELLKNWPSANEYLNELKSNGNLKEEIIQIPNTSLRPDVDFLGWKNNITMDYTGKLGDEKDSYPDGGYVWKVYEKTPKDSNMMYHTPILTAFLTKVNVAYNSVGNNDTDVSNACYDVTLPDGQQIKGISWKQVLQLQDQFTRVNHRGDGDSDLAYTASNAEKNWSVPDHLFGYYNSSQQGLNIFIVSGEVKPEGPSIPDREVSRNDYLYSDGHDTGDSKPSWYMHMPPVIYVEKTGVQIGDTMPWKSHVR